MPQAKSDPTSLNAAQRATQMLEQFANSYQHKVGVAASLTFGIRITDLATDWYVEIGSAQVALRPGPPPEPTVILTCDVDTLHKIYLGEWNVLTALGRARISDAAPMELVFMEGVLPSPELVGKFLPVVFHFFNRGSPEFVAFGQVHSRFVHGGNSVVLYYEPGLRTAWYQVTKGMIVNERKDEQTNPFASLFICTRGRGKARLNSAEYTLTEGTSVLVPTGMTHMFWNEYEQPFEFIVVMFGPEA